MSPQSDQADLGSSEWLAILRALAHKVSEGRSGKREWRRRVGEEGGWRKEWMDRGSGCQSKCDWVRMNKEGGKEDERQFVSMGEILVSVS